MRISTKLERVLRCRSTWLVAAALCAWIDVASGPFVRIDLIHVVPIAGASYFRNERFAAGLAMPLAILRPLLTLTGKWAVPWSALYTMTNALLSVVTFALAMVAAHQTKARRSASAEVRALRGLLPICAYCKNIRTDANAWERIEKYVSEHSDAQFTHGICPSCETSLFATKSCAG